MTFTPTYYVTIDHIEVNFDDLRLLVLPPDDLTFSQSCKLFMLVFDLAFIACSLLPVCVHGPEI